MEDAMAHGQEMEVTSDPCGLPQGIRVCMCDLVCLQLYSSLPCAPNTTGCRSKNLERGSPANGLSVHHEVTWTHPPNYTHVHLRTVRTQRTSTRRRHQSRATDEAQATRHTDVFKVINITIKRRRSSSSVSRVYKLLFVPSCCFYFLSSCCCDLNLTVSPSLEEQRTVTRV